MKEYKLKYRETGEVTKWTIDEILQEINRDRSEGWTPYNESDWREGLEMTDYELVS